MNMVFVCVGQRLTSGVLTQEPSTLTFCHLFICGRSESWSFIFFWSMSSKDTPATTSPVLGLQGCTMMLPCPVPFLNVGSRD